MKRSEINWLVSRARECFAEGGWALPPSPRWDVTDFGLGDWQQWGLVLVNLAEEPEYCEKLMYARRGMTTPAHTHRIKKEDIICRRGRLALVLWPSETSGALIKLRGETREPLPGEEVILEAGERITLFPGVWHEFWPESAECMIGEVSTANDDATDNIFRSQDIGRFPDVEEDEPPLVKLVSDE